MEDSQIIKLFLARNEDAIRHTDDTYGRRLYHLADGILRSGPDAEESVSDTYLSGTPFPPKGPSISLRIWRKSAGISPWTGWTGKTPPSAGRRWSA